MTESSDPTELAGAAEADTMSAYAWSGELEEAEDYPATTVWERIGPRKVTGLAIVGACVAVVAVGVAGWFVLHQPQRMSLTVIRPSVVVTTSVVTVAAPAPPTVTQVWTATATAEAVPPSVAPNIPPGPDVAYINMLTTQVSHFNHIAIVHCLPYLIYIRHTSL